jgi:dipeptide/tripeptide permease
LILRLVSASVSATRAIHEDAPLRLILRLVSASVSATRAMSAGARQVQAHKQEESLTVLCAGVSTSLMSTWIASASATRAKSTDAPNRTKTMMMMIFLLGVTCRAWSAGAQTRLTSSVSGSASANHVFSKGVFCLLGPAQRQCCRGPRIAPGRVGREFTLTKTVWVQRQVK